VNFTSQACYVLIETMHLTITETYRNLLGMAVRAYTPAGGQEDLEFKASQSNIARPCTKKKKRKKPQNSMF
jgi:hypothetical protein